MAVRRKRIASRSKRARRLRQRVKSRGKSQSRRQLAYQHGRRDGFLHGREEGFRQGHAAGLQAATLPSIDVLVITAGIIPSVEIGVLQPLEALKQRDNLSYDTKLESEVTKAMIAAANTIIFVRSVEPSAYQLLEMAHSLNKRVVYVIDDNFLELNPATPVGQYYADPARRDTFIKFLTHADIVKVDAPEMGNYVFERFNRNVVYFPASVDFEWLDQQARDERPKSQIVIGYEGGAKEEDFVPVAQALHKILAIYGNKIRLEFYGYVPPSLVGHPNVHHEDGGIEYREFLKKLNRCNWDIGLAPLSDNLFNRCKTNNKLREYGACRIAGIYSHSPVYAPWVTHRETGYLVPHSFDGWYVGICTMIEDSLLRERIRIQGEAMARQHFSLHTCVDSWKQLVLKI